MIFPPFRKPARDLEYIDYDLIEQEQDEDWVPTNDDEVDAADAIYDDDDLSVASGGCIRRPGASPKKPFEETESRTECFFE